MPKLLIVPDDLLKLEVRESFLDRRGVNTRAAINAEEALAIALTWQPQLVVFGSVQAGMTAASFVRRLREAVPNPRPRLIMVTSSVDEAAPRIDDTAYDAHLVAPVELDQLLATAAAVLDMRQRQWPRVRTTITVSLEGLLEDASEVDQTLANTIDLSAGGMRVEPRDPLRVGRHGTVTFLLPGSLTRLVLGCTVVALVDELLFHYGLTFTHVSDDEREMLRAFVDLHRPRRERHA
jgi:CheY-like chemotaxis protein